MPAAPVPMPIDPAPPPGLPVDRALSGAIPDILKWGVALLVIGGVAELLYKVSPGTGYAFVALVLFGLATVNGGLSEVGTKFFTNISIMAK